MDSPQTRLEMYLPPMISPLLEFNNEKMEYVGDPYEINE